MAFEVLPLDGSEDFTPVVPIKTATTIAGKNEIVSWYLANVTVLEKDENGKEKATQLQDWKSGKMRVDKGIILYITEGQVIDEGKVK